MPSVYEGLGHRLKSELVEVRPPCDAGPVGKARRLVDPVERSLESGGLDEVVTYILVEVVPFSEAASDSSTATEEVYLPVIWYCTSRRTASLLSKSLKSSAFRSSLSREPIEISESE